MPKSIIDEKKEFREIYIVVLNSVYKGRKKITDEQIDKITYSEGNHMTLDADQALAVGIEKEKVNSILPADASYHINDNK